MERYEHGGDVFSRRVDLDFSVNVNPLGMPGPVADALRGDVSRWSAYPDPECRALRAAIAAAIGVARDTVLCGAGAADLIVRLVLALRPERALVCAPTFSEYEKAALLAGARVERYFTREENGFVPGEDILGAIPGAGGVFFLCSPNNPTGTLTPPGLVARVADRCEELGAYFVVDECFLAFTGKPSARPLLKSHPRMIVLDAFTKLYAMAGLRLGFLLNADRGLLAKVAAFGQSWPVSAPAQTAGIAALACEPEWSERTRAFVARENVYLRARLRSLGLNVLGGEANYTLFRAPEELGARLLERGILIRSCANYDGLGAEYWRVGLKTREDNDRLLDAIGAVLAEGKSARPGGSARKSP